MFPDRAALLLPLTQPTPEPWVLSLLKGRTAASGPCRPPPWPAGPTSLLPARCRDGQRDLPPRLWPRSGGRSPRPQHTCLSPCSNALDKWSQGWGQQGPEEGFHHGWTGEGRSLAGHR